MWGRVIFEGCGFRALLMMTSGDGERSRGVWDEIDAALMRDLRAMRVESSPLPCRFLSDRNMVL